MTGQLVMAAIVTPLIVLIAAAVVVFTGLREIERDKRLERAQNDASCG